LFIHQDQTILPHHIIQAAREYLTHTEIHMLVIETFLLIYTLNFAALTHSQCLNLTTCNACINTSGCAYCTSSITNGCGPTTDVTQLCSLGSGTLYTTACPIGPTCSDQSSNCTTCQNTQGCAFCSTYDTLSSCSSGTCTSPSTSVTNCSDYFNCGVYSLNCTQCLKIGKCQFCQVQGYDACVGTEYPECAVQYSTCPENSTTTSTSISTTSTSISTTSNSITTTSTTSLSTTTSTTTAQSSSTSTSGSNTSTTLSVTPNLESAASADGILLWAWILVGVGGLIVLQ